MRCSSKLFLELCSLRKVFTLSCTLLTLLLVYQELINFLVTKPTTTSNEEKELQIRDLPEVVICLEPGLDSKAMEKYGYKSHFYYQGKADGQNFVGWNGRKGETNSSRDILEEVSVVKNQHTNSTKLITWAAYKTDYQKFRTVNVAQRTLAFPYGRCFSISPSFPQRNMSDTKINSLFLHFNETVLRNYKNYENILMGIYFMDRTNSLQIYPNENDIVGNPLKMRIANYANTRSIYKIKLSRSKHVQGDPLLKCVEYTLNSSYNDCVQNELLGSFNEIIGCQPPLLGNDPESMCNERFSVSKETSYKIGKLFHSIYVNDVKFRCQTPCTTNKFTTRVLHTVPHRNTVIVLVFDKTLEVTSSTFSISSQTLLTRLGGSVSSGRTLLWIILTLLGASQVISEHF